MALKTLTPIEAHVLGTLMEKARTVPDSYPLSLNALVLGCNQKTSREPLMEAGDDEVRAAIASLMAQSLAFEGSSGRVPRFEHNFQRAAGVTEAQAVVMGLLMLRGPQTPAELRTNGERWYKFSDAMAVEAVLQALQQRGDEGGEATVLKLPRAPGAHEQRWVHLLCGEPQELKNSWTPMRIALRWTRRRCWSITARPCAPSRSNGRRSSFMRCVNMRVWCFRQGCKRFRALALVARSQKAILFIAF